MRRMTTRAIVFLVAAGLLGIPLTITYNRMVKECMQYAPSTEYISNYFGYPGKGLRVVYLYRKYYPAGRLHIAFLTLLVLTAVCIISFLVSWT
jgi:hypothetical protein